ncbi:MAG: c-type cytochrome [Deltaproteobacteria bacterium]|nr:c-type cytochrome [Deltaproteobacteria bacterium]
MFLRLAYLLLPMLACASGLSFAADARLRGKAVFEAQCALCHGLSGDGNGQEADRFFTRPADLRRGIFKFRSTPTGSLPTDQDLERTIRRGLPGSAMVAQDHLSDAEIREVIAYLKTLSPRWINGAKPAPVAVVRPANLDSLAAKGMDLFKKAGCPECHGESGRGDGPSAGTLTSGGRPTRPADLTRRPFKGGDRPDDIYRALAAGLDGTPMPSYRDALEGEEIWALAVYVTRLAAPGAQPVLTDDERIGREVVAKHQPGRRR